MQDFGVWRERFERWPGAREMRTRRDVGTTVGTRHNASDLGEALAHLLVTEAARSSAEPEKLYASRGRKHRQFSVVKWWFEEKDVSDVDEREKKASMRTREHANTRL